MNGSAIIIFHDLDLPEANAGFEVKIADSHELFMPDCSLRPDPNVGVTSSVIICGKLSTLFS